MENHFVELVEPLWLLPRLASCGISPQQFDEELFLKNSDIHRGVKATQADSPVSLKVTLSFPHNRKNLALVFLLRDHRAELVDLEEISSTSPPEATA
jgi:hypothetical protein